MDEHEPTIADRRRELFTLPPEDFTAARNGMVRELRRSGAKEQAAALGELRRPTLAAWAVNQAVRADAEGYRALREAGRTLHRALRRAMSGVRGADVAGATRSRREHVRQMTERAAASLSEAGHDPAGHREEMAATFEAASADEELGEQVGAGELTRPLAAPSGFGQMSPLELASPPSETPADPGAADADVATADAITAEAAAAEAAAADADRRRQVEAARQRAEEAAEVADDLRRDAEASAERADHAEQQAREADAEAERALRAAEQSRRHAEELRRRAERRAQEAEDAAAVAERRAEELRAGASRQGL